MNKNIVILFSLCFCMFLSGCVGTFEKQANGYTIRDYKDIPNITESEITAIEAFKESGRSFTYGHIIETESFMLSDGTFDGFIIKCCNLFTELFDIDFVPVYYESWDNLKSEFDNKSIDFLGELTPSPERLAEYYMTAPIAERTLKIFTLESLMNITNEKDVENLKIGFLSGTVTENYIKKAYQVSFESEVVIDYSDAVAKLESGEIDAFIMEAVAAPAMDDYDFIISKDFFPLVFSPVSLSTANSDLQPIISVVDKYLMEEGTNRLYELYNEGNLAYTKNKLDKSFTDNEKEYITNIKNNNEKIKIAAEPDNYPISFYNNKETAFEGIVIDLLSEINNLTGLEFEFATGKDSSWASIMASLKDGEISMVTELVYSQERAKDFIWADIPSVVSKYALLSKSDYPNLSPAQIRQFTVGIMEGSIYDNMYSSWFPDNNNAVKYPTQNDAFEALEKGKIDLLMATELMLFTQTNYKEKPGYKVNIGFGMSVESLLGFNKDEEILRSIINKSLSVINITDISRSWTNRMFDYTTKMTNIRSTYLLIFSAILIIILAIVIFLFYKTKRLSIDLKRQTEEANIASKAKSTFLARVSHEIRTPLNAIIGMSNIAKSSITDNEKALSSISKVISSSHHLLGIINDVLDMSKIESGKLPLVYEPFSVMEAYSEVEDIINQRCQEKNIKFTTNINEMKNIILIGDKLRINQVLINLLGNAVKFTNNEGAISLLVNIIEEKEQEITIGFAINDNGIGMTKEQIERLFIPFEQANNTISIKYGGTGLGLSISQNLINMMNGNITIESQINKGSSFYFELTFEKGNKEIALSMDKGKNLDLTGKRILLAEDIDINREIIMEILNHTGVVFEQAENGEIALNMFKQSTTWYYDLIFMDIQMPNMNGYEATRKIRELDREDAMFIPIIAMTANAYKEDVDEALASGMNGHIAKPIDIMSLMSMLEKHTNDNNKLGS